MTFFKYVLSIAVLISLICCESKEDDASGSHYRRLITLYQGQLLDLDTLNKVSSIRKLELVGNAAKDTVLDFNEMFQHDNNVTVLVTDTFEITKDTVLQLIASGDDDLRVYLNDSLIVYDTLRSSLYKWSHFEPLEMKKGVSRVQYIVRQNFGAFYLSAIYRPRKDSEFITHYLPEALTNSLMETESIRDIDISPMILKLEKLGFNSTYEIREYPSKITDIGQHDRFSFFVEEKLAYEITLPGNIGDIEPTQKHEKLSHQLRKSFWLQEKETDSSLTIRLHKNEKIGPFTWIEIGDIDASHTVFFNHFDLSTDSLEWQSHSFTSDKEMKRMVAYSGANDVKFLVPYLSYGNVQNRSKSFNQVSSLIKESSEVNEKTKILCWSKGGYLIPNLLTDNMILSKVQLAIVSPFIDNPNDLTELYLLNTSIKTLEKVTIIYAEDDEAVPPQNIEKFISILKKTRDKVTFVKNLYSSHWYHYENNFHKTIFPI